MKISIKNCKVQELENMIKALQKQKIVSKRFVP